MHSRIVIEQAKGIVAEQAGIPIDDAFERLRRHARNHNRRLHDVAVAVIEGEVAASGLAM